MKRKLLSALAAVTALAFASCSMFDTTESNEGKNGGEKAYITLDLQEISRQALPEIAEAKEFEEITLFGTKAKSGELTISRTWTSNSETLALAQMKAAKIEAEAGESYSFTLRTQKGGAVWKGTAEKTLVAGENALSFKLALADILNEGQGEISITISLPENVKGVQAELKDIAEANIINASALSIIEGKASYTKTEVDAGNYVIIFSLYGDKERTLKLGEWREYAGVAKGFTSSSNPAITSKDELENIYKITYELDGGTLSAIMPGSYTRYSEDIFLPESSNVSKENFKFAGWKNEKGDFVTKIAAGSSGDIILTATWKPTTLSPISVKLGKLKGNEKFTIEWDKASNTFTAPEANEYRWYLDGIMGYMATKQTYTLPSKISYGYHTIMVRIRSLNYLDLAEEFTFEVAEPDPATVSFSGNADDAEGFMSSFMVPYGTKVEIPENQFIRDGYDFAGWNTNADGTGTSYTLPEEDPEATPSQKILITVTENITLYAQWKQHE